MPFRSSNSLLVLLMLPFVAIACHYQSAVDEEELLIRVENASSFGMRDVQVTFHEGKVNYGDLDPGENSDYKTISRAYRYQPVEMTVDGKTARLQPVDFVGEELLDAGRYTYELDINEEIFESDPEYSVTLSLKRE